MISSRSVFVDTSGWARYLNRQDPLHAETARAFWQVAAQRRDLVTTNYVLSELVPLMTVRMKIARMAVLSAVERIHALKYLSMVYIDEGRDNQAWLLLRQYQDKEWSLVDAASFVVMREYSLTDALTTDHHFEQAGFVRLLKP